MKSLVIFFKGMLCGVANIIPGVSGGTFALILGIYERLIGSLRAFGLQTIKTAIQALSPAHSGERKNLLAKEIRRTDAIFIFWLGLGALAAIGVCARLISFLLDQHRAPMLGFFIGLIVPSVLVPYYLLERKGWKEILVCVAGILGVVSLTVFLQPDNYQGTGLAMMFISGAVAISAMILPGVSGSFVLMVLDQYETVLEAVNTLDFVKLAVFSAGCLVGLAFFVRLLDLLLKRYHSITMAFLIGLILGSLWVLWPFKEVAQGAKFITGTNIMPTGLDSLLLWSIAAFAAGLICSMGVHRLGNIKNRNSSDEAEELS